MGANLTAQVRNIAEVTTAVARGDLSRKITVDVKGEILELKNTINTMVDQLRAFAAEVTRVAREVGTEGKLGGQAEVPGVAGTWKDLTDSVNVMAANLTDQVRGIVKVVTAVADGNLRQKLTVEAKGEVAALAETINNMTDTLATFAEQVTNVAREVGVEGRLGGQAQRARRRRHLEGPHRQRQPAGRQPDQPGARDRRSGDRRDQGRPDAVDSGRGARRGRRAQRQHQHDDRQPARHDRSQPGAGLAEDQPREVHAHAAGPARSRHRRQAAAVGAGAARQRAAGRGLPDAQRRAPTARRRCRCSPAMRSATTRPRASRSARAWSASARSRSSASCSPRCRRSYARIHSSLGAAPPEEHRGAAGAVRRRDQGGHRAGVAPAVHRDPPDVPRAAHAVDRRRAQHHRSDDAHREPAAAVAAAHHRAADAADRAAADQRGARLEGQAAGRAERRGRAQEQGSRAGAPRARREGRGAGAHLEVQVRVPRQHVARAAHAAQLDSDPRPAARRKRRRQPVAASRSTSPGTSTRPAPTC